MILFLYTSLSLIWSCVPEMNSLAFHFSRVNFYVPCLLFFFTFSALFRVSLLKDDPFNTRCDKNLTLTFRYDDSTSIIHIHILPPFFHFFCILLGMKNPWKGIKKAFYTCLILKYVFISTGVSFSWKWHEKENLLLIMKLKVMFASKWKWLVG